MSQESSVMETVIIGSLLHNPEYSSTVLPHTKADFFENGANKTLYAILTEYLAEYGSIPTAEAIQVEVENRKGLNEETFQETAELIEKLYQPALIQNLAGQDKQWLLDKTEKHFKDRACYLAIMKSVSILDGEDKKFGRDAIPDLLAEAVKISFDSSVGHDYLEDWEKRYDFYHRKENKIPFPLYMLNKVTRGGPTKKSLSLVIAPTGGGKSIMLCNCAAFSLMQGQKVLYLTLEMAEELIAERIDAQLMQVTLDDVKKMEKGKFQNGVVNLAKRAKGKLIVKQFPPRTITVKHIEALLDDLKNKRNFVPDVLCVDYLTLMNSYILAGGDNTYLSGKYVSEELRSLAIRKDLMVISAMQANREAQKSSDYDITNISESLATAQTADFIFALMTNEEMEKMGHVRIKLLKNRFGPISEPSSFVVGLDKSRMTFYDLDTGNDYQGQQEEPPPIQQQTNPTKTKASFVFD